MKTTNRLATALILFALIASTVYAEELTISKILENSGQYAKQIEDLGSKQDLNILKDISVESFSVSPDNETLVAKVKIGSTELIQQVNTKDLQKQADSIAKTAGSAAEQVKKENISFDVDALLGRANALEKVTIKKTKDNVTIGTGSIEANSTGRLELENQKIYIRDDARKQVVNFTPEQAIAISGIGKVQRTELRTGTFQASYEISGRKSGKIFGIFEVEFDKKTVVSAQTGQVISEEQPFWGFLVG